MKLLLDTSSMESYRQFLAVKGLPSWKIKGHIAEFPDEYAELITGQAVKAINVQWDPAQFLFDYQRDITKIAIKKRKYALFMDCGFGKTVIFLEFAQAAMKDLAPRNRGFLIVSPLMVVKQTQQECQRWYGFEPEFVPAAILKECLGSCGGKIGITNYEAIRPDLQQGQLGGLVLDESSMLKSMYGKWGTKLIELGKGLNWKLCSTGTPAPNDRIEYANHAVFLDAFPTTNSFLATYFVNRGQTSERWAIKDHALGAFYKALSHWCIFLTNPSTYGWQDNATDTIPPIHTHIHEVELSDKQKQLVQQLSGAFFTTNLGGIKTRSAYGQIAKGHWHGKDIETLKPRFIHEMIDTWKDTESTLVWCIYNPEQDRLERELSDSAGIAGNTPHEKRMEIIDAFKAGQVRTLVTKAKVMGFGLNLQVATRQMFSGLQDSWENFINA